MSYDYRVETLDTGDGLVSRLNEMSRQGVDFVAWVDDLISMPLETPTSRRALLRAKTINYTVAHIVDEVGVWDGAIGTVGGDKP
jgi:hypothetical protein